MTEVCFFNQPMSDFLQHIAVFFEVGAIYLVWQDYKIRESDLSEKGELTMIMELPVSHPKRTWELIFAFGIGVVAILMELYQLLSQYLSC